MRPADTLIPKLVGVFWRQPHCMGVSNYPASPGTLSEIVALLKGGPCARLSDDDRSWIFAKTAQQLYPVLKD